MNSRWKWKIAQRLELIWWKRYLKSKKPEQYSQWKKKYWSDMLQKLRPELSLSKGDKVLDAGCGPAGIFMVLHEQEVIAIDPLLDSYSEQLTYFKAENYPYVSFNSIPLEQLELQADRSVAFCLNAINHVNDIDLSMDQLCTAVKPGGQLVFSIDAHNHQPLKHLFRWIPGDALHPHQYDLDEYKEMLTSRGFEILKNVRLKSEFFFDHYVLLAKRK